MKVLEALASGKAVVATSLATEGLDLAPGEQLEVADDEAAFARALVRLLGDEDARRALGARARTWAVENLGWEGSVSRYEELYESLLATAPAA